MGVKNSSEGLLSGGEIPQILFWGEGGVHILGRGLQGDGGGREWQGKYERQCETKLETSSTRQHVLIKKSPGKKSTNFIKLFKSFNSLFS